jgi:ParB-like chromosome segregation protein Spo0J
VKVSKLKFNPDNPRKISPTHLDKLKKSIKDFPQMMELRPIVYDPQTMCVLGGNQRLAAIKALDMTEIPDNWVLSADKLSDKQKKEFILKDNIPLGEWDFAILETAFDEFDFNDIGIGETEEKNDMDIDEKDKPIKPISNVHYLISVPLDKVIDVKNTINAIKNIQGVEIEQSQN